MGRSRTRKMRPRAPLFPFASTSTPTPSNDNNDESSISISDDEHKNDMNLLETSAKESNDVIKEEENTATVSVSPLPPPATSMNHHDSMCFLKIIGSIQNGQKLRHTSNHPNQSISIDPNQWSSSISRWWNGDSRTQSVKVLRDRFNQVFKNIDESYEQHHDTPSVQNPKNAFHRSPKDVLLDYARELTGAEKGLRHLCHTYKHDIPIASELQVMLESVSIRKQTIDSMFTIH